MPPKHSDLVHVTFHFDRSAVVLSVKQSSQGRSVGSLKSSLLPALRPFASILPAVPNSERDFQLWEDKPLVQGAEIVADDRPEIRCLEDVLQSKSLVSLGWPRWKTVYVGFKKSDGTFGNPVYTIPQVDDGDEGVEEEADK